MVQVPPLAGPGDRGGARCSNRRRSAVCDLPPDVERLALLGWRLHPSSRSSRAACFTDAVSAATSDLDQLARWSRQFPCCNWRVVMEGSGIWALDVDAPGPDHAADGITALAVLVAEHGPIAERPMTRSGGGGFALFFRHQGEPISGKTGTPVAGLDPRRGRLSVTIPPSIHHRTKLPYRWIVPPWELSPPAPPEWLLRLVAPPTLALTPRPPQRYLDRPDRFRRYAVAALRNAANRVAGARPGTRNDTHNREAFSLHRFTTGGALAVAEIAEAMGWAARMAGLDRLETQQTLNSALHTRVPT